MESKKDQGQEQKAPEKVEPKASEKDVPETKPEVKQDETPEVKPPETPNTDKAPEFNIKDLKVGDKVEFYPTGAEKPSTVVVDDAFLKLELPEEIITKHKYSKV